MRKQNSSSKSNAHTKSYAEIYTKRKQLCCSNKKSRPKLYDSKRNSCVTCCKDANNGAFELINKYQNQ